jgi:hypothetical protein
MHHRYELSQECTRRKNKLVAICDELFPELTQVMHDPNAPMALAIRERFPTPQAIATATLSALAELRTRNRPSNAQLADLQDLAHTSIGTKDVVRQRSLILEQSQLIKELRLLQEHMQQLDTEICKIVEQSREGKILTSMGAGPTQAASIIAAVGNILNFENAAALKSYFGWAPKMQQSGTSIDQVSLTHAGSRTMKQMMFLLVGNLIHLKDNEWAKLYERLVQKKCPYDERTRTYRGRVKVVARVAGQMIEMMFALLKQDAEVLRNVPRGETPPEPIVYDPELHRRHRNGEYQPIKSTSRTRSVIRLPEPTH